MLKKVLSIVIPIFVGGVFLYLTFGDIDFAEFWLALKSLPPGHLLVLFAILLLQYVLRSWRWFLLLPRPHRPGEFRATFKALVMGYAITQVASRLGEVYRIWDLRSMTKREFGSVTSTVFLERILLDFTVFIAMMVYVFAFFQQEVQEQLPQAPIFMNILVSVTLGGLGGLVFLAVKPDWVEGIATGVGLFRLPLVGRLLRSLFADFVKGLAFIKSPMHYFELLFVNILTWISAFSMTWYCMWAFGVDASLSQALFIFTLGTVGVLIPSPGGVGVFHYLVATGMVALMGIEESIAVAFATVLHGTIMGGTILLGMIFYYYKPPVVLEEPEMKSNGAEPAQQIPD
jgi:uncharacterized protein (TIRG00374 family)